MDENETKGATITETQKHTGAPREAVAAEFAALEAEGFVRKTGQFRDGEPVYVTTAAGEKYCELNVPEPDDVAAPAQ